MIYTIWERSLCSSK